MNHTQISYVILAIAFVVAVFLDLFVFSKSNKKVSLKSASFQYLFWVLVAIAFGIYLYISYNQVTAINYFSAYLMEMALSIDNIFVFVLIFSSLKISEKDIGRSLLIGVLLAIVLRILFIAIGIVLVQQFHWILYVFGAFLIFTGIKLFLGNHEDESDVKDGAIYKFVTKYLRYTEVESNGQYTITNNGKVFFTRLALVIVIIGFTDILFALDSIPAVFAITTDNLVVFSSNIFAVLGLRALFFILQKASDKFDYLQQGIAIVLVFIGAKMFLEIIHIYIPVWISLLSIVSCIGTSIIYSIKKD
jgi:tellurite resistance protein TerC